MNKIEPKPEEHILITKGNEHTKEWSKPNKGQGLISWEDTVIEGSDCIQAFHNLECHKDQAKISFPTGEKQGYEKGIREVVEFIDWLDNGTRSSGSWRSEMRKFRQAQLKKWGD